MIAAMIRLCCLLSAALRDMVPLATFPHREVPELTMSIKSFLRHTIVLLFGLVCCSGSARRIRMFWVTIKSEIVYAPDGSVTGVRHAWTFDDMFSAFATQGLEAKKTGEFTARSSRRWPR